jgi:hypothetical protein
MEPFISDRFERCAACGAVIRPKDDCGMDEDLLYCEHCFKQWMYQVCQPNGPEETYCLSDEEAMDMQPGGYERG